MGKLSFNTLILSVIFILFSSCSTPDYTEYKLTINVEEFEIKHSQDLFDRKPEAFIRVKTEIDKEESDIYNDYKVNFVEQGKVFNPILKGETFDDEIEFFVGVYDLDLLEDIISLFSLDDPENESDYIGGTFIKVKIPSGVMSGTVTVENDDIHLIFSYSIHNIVEK